MSDPRYKIQAEAEKTFEQFMNWTKRVVYISIFMLIVVVVGCNSGVETGETMQQVLSIMVNNTTLAILM